MNETNITLRINNFHPTLELHRFDSQNETPTITPMVSLSHKIDDLLIQIANAAEFEHENIEDIFSHARTGEEDAIEFPQIPYADESWSAEYILNHALKQIEESKKSPAYAEIEDMSEEVRDALDHFWKANLFASALEEIYALLIAKTVFTASELGIGTIVINDDQKQIRLLEKASKEMGAIPEIKLVVV